MGQLSRTQFDRVGLNRRRFDRLGLVRNRLNRLGFCTLVFAQRLIHQQLKGAIMKQIIVWD